MIIIIKRVEIKIFTESRRVGEESLKTLNQKLAPALEWLTLMETAGSSC